MIYSVDTSLMLTLIIVERCEPVPIYLIPNALALDFNASLSNTVEVACDPGYRFSNNISIHEGMCGAGLKWTGFQSVPGCIGCRDLLLVVFY